MVYVNLKHVSFDANMYLKLLLVVSSLQNSDFQSQFSMLVDHRDSPHLGHSIVHTGIVKYAKYYGASCQSLFRNNLKVVFPYSIIL